MKRILAIVLVLVAGLIIFIGCNDDSSKITIIPVSPGSLPYGSNPGDKFTFTADDVSFKMAYVPVKSFKYLVDDSATATVTGAFWIGESEVTYELWYTVHTWALSNGYTFANPGREGHDGTITAPAGAAPTTALNEPVTMINWRDAMIWCNAATEWFNAMNGTALLCAYYTDSDHTTPLRDSSDGIYGSSVNSNNGSFDNPYIRDDASGFRLLSISEWELSARYIIDVNNDGDITDDGEYYPGDYASGAAASTDNVVATQNVAWYSSNSSSMSHEVAGLLSNGLGLYDMSGNVWEWCFDWHPSYIGSDRAGRGGGWGHDATGLQVGHIGWQGPYYEDNLMGFRIGKNQ